MAQHDYIISNATFPNVRADINSVLSAISTNNSGTSAPTTQYAGQFWIDTTSSTWTMYIHDGSDDIAFATIDTSANTVNFTDSALDVVTDTTPQLGGNLDLNSNDITGTGNINITGNLTSTGIDDNATSNAITIESSERVQFTRPRSNTLGDSALEIKPSDTVVGVGFRMENTNNDIVVEKSSPSGSEAEIFRIRSGGGIALGGTGDANTLDDYEEGTWTPSIATAGGTLSVTYAEQTGKYTKIGNLVFYEFFIETSAFSGGTGSITFSTFPFTAQSGRGAVGLATGSRVDLGLESAAIQPIQNTSTFRIFIKNSTGTGSSNNITVFDASDWSNLNPTNIYGAGYYRTDS